MKKLLYCLLIFALGCNGQTTVTMPTLRGGSLATFNGSNVPGGYALIHTSDTTYAYYRQLPNGDLTPAGPNVIYKADGTHWRRLTAIGGTITSWLSISDKPTLYTSPAALRDALASLSGSNRLDYSALKNTPTFGVLNPILYTTPGGVHTFGFDYPATYSTYDGRYLRSSGNASISGSYQINSSDIVRRSGNYSQFLTSSINIAFSAGNGSDKTNTYKNDTHIYQNVAGSEVARLTLADGLLVGYTTNQGSGFKGQFNGGIYANGLVLAKTLAADTAHINKAIQLEGTTPVLIGNTSGHALIKANGGSISLEASTVSNVGGTTGVGFNTYSGDFKFQQINFPTITDLVTIKNNGRVGIGTASPGSSLEVAGDVKISSGGLMVGAGALTGYNVRISKNIAGASSSYGIFQDGEVQAITSGSGIVNGARIATGATLTNYYHFRTLELANGGTVANNYGLQVNNLTYGTNNYGIYNAVTSGANKWGYYGAGGAPIYNAGAVSVGTTGTTSPLNVAGLSDYADNAAAVTAGLAVGAFYRTGDVVKVVH